MKYLRINLIAVIALCQVLCISGWVHAQSASGSDPAPDQPPEAVRATADRTARFPLDVAGYLDVRNLGDDEEARSSYFREYAASVFLSKTVNRWLFHSEINANTAPEWDSEGIHLFPRASNLSVKLETASLNYNWRDWLQGQAGFIFVPTYWRTHRYQSTVLTVDDPLIDQSVFPTAFTGVMIHGDKYFEEGGFSYQLYGGAGQQARFHDAVPGDALRRSRSVGGRFVWHVPSRHVFDALDVGVHLLRADYRIPDDTRTDFRGAELNVGRGRIRLLAEYATSSDVVQFGTPGGLRAGYYLQPSYRITSTLYAVAQSDRLTHESRQSADAFRLTRLALGLTYRPVPSVSLKVEAERSQPLRSSLPVYYGVTAGIVYLFRTP
jgi:hypothetical protein